MKQLPVITLRAMEPEDLEVLYTIENDRSLWDMGTSNVPYSRYSLRDYIVHASNDIYVDRQVRLVIENSEHQVVGLADLANFDPQHLRAELGLVVLRQYQRRGYAEAAVVQVLDYARHILHLHQLYVIIDQRNEAALQIFRKYCFIEAGASKIGYLTGKNTMMPAFFKEFYNFSLKRFGDFKNSHYLCTR